GRLPVRSNAELAEVIAKTLDYASRSYHYNAVLAADKQEPNVSFTSGSEVFEAMLGENWSTTQAYLDREPVEAARDRLISAINQGVSLTSFVGHSSHTVWTFDGLFSSADIDQLGNYGRPTAVVQYGCWNSYHVIPSYNTLGHRFMLAEDRGAAVVVGSSTWTEATSGQQLGERLMPLLSQAGMTVGQALTYAKQDLAQTQPQRKDAILGWTILGDPAIVIAE
ncbi:MAG: C25 family cysteine peptidase, partial [Wenzhouxiangellaceae bacterium]